jgi:hypothetical protein
MNVAWMFEWYDRQQGRPGLFPWMEYSPFLKRLYAHVGMIDPGVVLEQVVWSVTLALLIFFFLRLLAFFLSTQLFLRTVAGAVAVLGFPLFYLIIANYTFYGLGSGTRTPGVWLEVAAALTCCVLYYLRKLPPPIGVALLALHFGFWGRAAGSWSGMAVARSYAVWTLAFWIVALFHGGFPIIGIMSTLGWGKYLNERSSALSAK